MNEKITITFLSGDLKDTSGEKVNILDVFEEDIMLKPFYATEDDIISVFMQDKVKYWDMTRKIIFNASVKADFFLRNYKFDEARITQQQVFQLKRDYVICSSVYQFAKQFNADFLKSVNKTKMLGDLKVTVGMHKAGNGANIIMQDAQACVDELEQTFDLLRIGVAEQCLKVLIRMVLTVAHLSLEDSGGQVSHRSQWFLQQLDTINILVSSTRQGASNGKYIMGKCKWAI